MIALVLTKDGYKNIKYPLIQSKSKNISILKAELDTLNNVTYVAAFSDENWLMSDFVNETQMNQIYSLLGESTEMELECAQSL
jgi:hypothetical protein